MAYLKGEFFRGMSRWVVLQFGLSTRVLCSPAFVQMTLEQGHLCSWVTKDNCVHTWTHP